MSSIYNESIKAFEVSVSDGPRFIYPIRDIPIHYQQAVGGFLSFYEPQSTNYDQIIQLRDWVYGLLDGSILKVRGRDLTHVHDDMISVNIMERLGPIDTNNPLFTEWEYGIAVKFERVLFLLWPEKVERYSIGSIDYINLLHFAAYSSECEESLIEIQHNSKSIEAAIDNSDTIILCHGFSPEQGPNYPLIKLLIVWLLGFQNKRWNVIIPDFRSTYKYGSARGRSERCKVILEEIIALRPQNSNIVLIGHSQGGAAAAQCCSEKVVKGGNIKGLIMIGSESPIEKLPNQFDYEDNDNNNRNNNNNNNDLIHLDRPRALDPNQIMLIHSDKDRVISHLQIQQLSEFWGGVPYFNLVTNSKAENELYCDWADDVQHDFMALDLLPNLLHLINNFLTNI
eukprot:gene7674-10443_t